MYWSWWIAAIFCAENGVAIFTRRSGANGSAHTQRSARISCTPPRSRTPIVTSRFPWVIRTTSLR